MRHIIYKLARFAKRIMRGLGVCLLVLVACSLAAPKSENTEPLNTEPCTRQSCALHEKCIEANGEGICVPEMCEQLGGHRCADNEVCPGSNPVHDEPCCAVPCVNPAEDPCVNVTCPENAECVAGSCALKSCEALEGHACKNFRECPQALLQSSDAEFCCAEPCLDITLCVDDDQCQDNETSTKDVCVEDVCQHLPITTCQQGDNYCTPGCSGQDDKDCLPKVICQTDRDCDDGIIRTKKCEGRYENGICVSGCRCVSLLIDECKDDDSLCPEDCNENNDNDCKPKPEIILVEPLVLGDEFKHTNMSCRDRWWAFFSTNSTFKESVEVALEFYVDDVMTRKKDMMIYPGMNEVAFELGRQELNNTVVRLLVVSNKRMSNTMLSKSVGQNCT